MTLRAGQSALTNPQEMPETFQDIKNYLDTVRSEIYRLAQYNAELEIRVQELEEEVNS